MINIPPLILDEFFYPFLKQEYVPILIYFFFTLFTHPFYTIIIPEMYSKLFDFIKKTPATGLMSFNSIFKIFDENAPAYILRIIAVFLLLQLAFFLKSWSESLFIPKFLEFSRTKIFKKTLDRHSDDYQELGSGEFITRMMEVSRYMSHLFNWGFSEVIPTFLAIILMVGYFFTIDKTVFSLLLFNLVFVFAVYGITGCYLLDVSKKREEEYYNLSKSLNDSISNLMNIYLNNSEGNEKKNNLEKNKNLSDAYTTHKFTEGILVFATLVMTYSIYGLSLIYLYNEYVQKHISASKFIAVVLLLGNYNQYMYTVISDISNACFTLLGMIEASMPFLNDLFSYNSKRTKNTGITKGNIQFKNITYRYKDQEHVLFDNFNLTIKSGEKVALLGPSGSGKTSLMKLLVSMYKPLKGEILIDGNDISLMKQEYIRKNIIYINQRTNLFDMNIIDNIAYGNEHVDKRAIPKILRDFHLDTVFNELEDGINSNAGINGSNLSGGMQKVVILLRGILKKGTIFIFDEPLAGLDALTREKVIKLIIHMTKGKTLLVVTHDKEILPFMDRVINMKKLK